MRIHVNVNQTFTAQEEKTLRAFVTVFVPVFGGEELVVTGVRVTEYKSGLRVRMPSRAMKNGAYKDIVFARTPKLRHMIAVATLNAYDQYAKMLEDDAENELVRGYKRR